MSQDNPQTTPSEWECKHYGHEDRFVYSGLDIGRGDSKTAWRCFCGRNGVVDEADIGCERWGCPAKEFLS